MNRESPDPSADVLSDDILTGMPEWRLQHPDATLTEIEQALDQRWYRLRARMLEDRRLSVRPPIGRPLPLTVRPALTVAARSFAAVASRVTSKPMAATT